MNAFVKQIAKEIEKYAKKAENMAFLTFCDAILACFVAMIA